jgi:predicted transcriptional regulator
VLSLLALRTLSKRSEVHEGALRFFLDLVCLFDLTAFRMLNIPELSDRLGIKEKTIRSNLEILLRVGLLERGPMAKRVGSDMKETSFRIRPAMMLTRRELAEHFEARHRETERMEIAPRRSDDEGIAG